MHNLGASTFVNRFWVVVRKGSLWGSFGVVVCVFNKGSSMWPVICGFKLCQRTVLGFAAPSKGRSLCFSLLTISSGRGEKGGF